MKSAFITNTITQEINYNEMIFRTVKPSFFGGFNENQIVVTVDI